MSFLRNSIIFSDNAVQRPLRTIRATNVFTDNADEIAGLCAGAKPKEVVLAVVNADLEFGVWRLPTRELTERIALLPEGGWSLTFAPGTSVDEIRARCKTVARLARKRSQLVQSWRARTV